LLLLSLSPTSMSSTIKSVDVDCSWVILDSLNHAITGLGLPVARQEKVAFSDSTTVRLSGGSSICGATACGKEEIIQLCW